MTNPKPSATEAMTNHPKTWNDWRERVKSFSKLKKNWDSYGADRIKQSAIEEMLKHIDELEKTSFSPEYCFFAPTRNGFVCFEYEKELQ